MQFLATDEHVVTGHLICFFSLCGISHTVYLDYIWVQTGTDKPRVSEVSFCKCVIRELASGLSDSNQKRLSSLNAQDSSITLEQN